MAKATSEKPLKFTTIILIPFYPQAVQKSHHTTCCRSRANVFLYWRAGLGRHYLSGSSTVEPPARHLTLSRNCRLHKLPAGHPRAQSLLATTQLWCNWLGAPGETRTHNLCPATGVLCLLSYGGTTPTYHGKPGYISCQADIPRPMLITSITKPNGGGFVLASQFPRRYLSLSLNLPGVIRRGASKTIHRSRAFPWKEVGKSFPRVDVEIAATRFSSAKSSWIPQSFIRWPSS